MVNKAIQIPGREQGYTPSGPGSQNPAGMYPVAGPKKTYITDPIDLCAAATKGRKLINTYWWE